MSPDTAMPTWLSILKTFFWYDERSASWESLRAAITACVLFLMPTAHPPCFTASMAYSTWKMRPWGLQVVTSVSYCVRPIESRRELV